MNVFARYAPFIQDYIYRSGWKALRGVQDAAGEAIFGTEENVLITASTASGKTEAAFFPILTLLDEDPPKSVGVLYIAPLKALINDQSGRMEELCGEAGIPVTRWHGDVPQSQKRKLMKKPRGLLQITPESLESLMINKHMEIPSLFCDLRYVIIDEETGRKMVCVDPNDIPVLAIIDAELMATMPKGLTAATGMDALTHAIEGYITKGAWELSDMFELKAIELIAKHLPAATANGKDMTAREGMALAQYVAGMAFSNVGLGCVHSMAHPLGARFDIAHGVANALLLPVVMEFNLPAAKGKYAEIAKAMSVDVSAMDADEAAAAAVKAVKDLSVSLGIPQTLREIGIPEAALPQLAKDAFADVCTGGNPREITEADILELYKIAY